MLTELDQARASLQQVAHYYALTSLLNRRGFNQIFAEKLAQKSLDGGMLGKGEGDEVSIQIGSIRQQFEVLRVY